jgi:IclR family KDG regulon transcriptional repressor
LNNGDKDATTVRAVERALDILKCFNQSDVELSLGEISDRVNLAKSTVHRLLSTLEQGNFIAQDEENGKYKLSFEVIRLGVIASDSIDLKRIAYSVMKNLSAKCGQTSNLYVIQGYERLCISQVAGPHYIKRHSYFGNLLPLYAGASGKLLLAYQSEEWLNRFFDNVKLEKLTENTITNKDSLIKELKKIRKQGYASSSSERDIVSSSVSVPIFNYTDEVVASLTISGPSVMFTKENIDNYISLLIEASNKISSRLGYKNIK